jgi:hypothetical protein
MPVAIGSVPVGVLATMLPLGTSTRVESAVLELGVTIVCPSKLIVCACGVE